MKVIQTTLYVDDQDKALKFYTKILGFIKKADVENDGYRWLTVVASEDEDCVELILQLDTNPIAKAFQKHMFDQNYPAIMFGVENVKKEYERLSELGVDFVMEPKYIGVATIARFDDTVGNLIQISEQTKKFRVR
ncbi:MAG: VOC family protein [Fastidiosipila sp.]|nr:VOC family protein [Fastidiosipila sp.]